MMEEDERQYQSFEETRSNALFLAAVRIGEGHLKYADDPVGMINDPENRYFALPFRDYCLKKISFEDAQGQLSSIRQEILERLTIAIHENWLRVVHDKATGRDLDADVSGLDDPDEKLRREAALAIVRSFPMAYEANEKILSLIAEAKQKNEDERGFLFPLFDASIKKRGEENWPDKKRRTDLSFFQIFHEDEILTRPFEEIVEMAKKELDSFKSPDALRKQLARHGLKTKGSVGRPQKKNDVKKREARHYWQGEIEKTVDAHKGEFSRYLFGDEPIREIEAKVKKIKSKLFGSETH